MPSIKALLVTLASVGAASSALAANNTVHWISQPAPSASSFRAIWGNGSDLYIVGDQGAILSSQNNSTWKEQVISDSTRPDLYSVWGVGSDVYAVGTLNEVAVFLRRSGGTWQNLSLSSVSALPFAFYGVWGNAKEVYAVGKKGKAVKYSIETGKFSACGDTKLNNDLFAVMGNVRDNSLYAVGAGGTILRSVDGCATWFNVTNKVVTGADLDAIWISPSDEIYVVGKDGAFLVSKDKGPFTNVASRLPASSPKMLSGISGSAAEMFITSQEGNIIRSRDNGQSWSIETSCAQGALTSIASNAGEVLAIGEHGVILKAPKDTSLEIQVRDNVVNLNGAEVFIDGELFKTLPLPGPIRIPPGRHFIQVKKANFIDFAQWLDIPEGRNTPLWVTSLQGTSRNPSVTLNVTNGRQAIPDAVLFVDGVASKSPAASTLELTPGRHLIEVKKGGYDDFSAWVDLQENQKSLISVLLNEQPGDPKLELKSKTEDATLLKGANVFFDGELIGPYPLAKQPTLSEGRHLVEVKKDSFEEFSVWVNLKKGETVSLFVTLRPMPTDAWLEIKTKLDDAALVKGAEVLVDGDVFGTLPLTKAPTLTLGRHHIEIRKQGYQTESYWLNIKAGESPSITYYPEASKDPTLQVEADKTSAPLDGAELWVDGILWGTLPLGQPKTISPGRHLVEVKKAGYSTDAEWIEVAKDKGRTTRIISVHLEPVKSPSTQPITVP